MLTDGRRTDDGRMDDGRTDDGVTGILIAHLGAFGSGELIIKVIIHKHKISKSKDKKICRDWGSNLQMQNFGTEVYDLTTAPAQL